jgi:dipeptidyl aminopeptidase/acylaminoacyl peptidase
MATKKIILSLIIVLIIFTGVKLMNKYNISDNDNLIPKEILFGNPEKFSLIISPNGEYIAYIAPLNEVLNIFVANINDIKNPKSITNSTVNAIRNFTFAYDGDHILYTQDKDGDENHHIKSVNIHNNTEIDLTPEPDTKNSILQKSKHKPNTILITNNNRNKNYFDLYSLDITTGKKTILYKNEEYSSYITDDNFDIRFLTKSTEDGGVDIFAYTPNEIKLFMNIPNSDIATTNILAFGPNNDIIYILDSRDSDKSKLFSYHTKNKEKKEIIFNEKDEIQNIILNPITKEIEAFVTEYFKQNIYPINNNITDDLKFLATKSGNVNIVSRDNNDLIWTIAYVSDDKSTTYYLYKRDTKELTELFSQKPKLDQYNLTKMHPVEIKSRDFLTLVSYLSLPIEKNNNIKNKPSKPLPLILYVHGGPSVRDSWGLNSVHQWLANRGYAVLSVNYRGSTGFGKKFFEAGFGEWSGKMHDDLIDAVNWAVNEKIADKDKICIMGGSYGGYATLVGLTFTPDVFACGIDIVGPSNLVTLLNTIPAYWKPARKFLENLTGGNPDTEEGKKILEAKSPLNFVDKIKKPLLIGQGANDPRVKQSESDQIVQKMMQNNIPVSYILFPDEGHGFAKPHNSIAFFTMAEKFLGKILGGKVENNIISEKSSMQIIEGEQYLK